MKRMIQEWKVQLLLILMIIVKWKSKTMRLIKAIWSSYNQIHVLKRQNKMFRLVISTWWHWIWKKNKKDRNKFNSIKIKKYLIHKVWLWQIFQIKLLGKFRQSLKKPSIAYQTHQKSFHSLIVLTFQFTHIGLSNILRIFIILKS